MSRLFFVMIKPDGVKRGLVGEIISRFEKRGFVLQSARFIPSAKTVEVIDAHYMSHSESVFYDDLIEFSLSGPVIAMIWAGDVRVARGLIGDTVPSDSKPGTIRGDFSSSMMENLIHCSASLESAVREVELWKPFLDF